MSFALRSNSVSIGMVLVTLALSALFLARGATAYVAAALPGAAHAMTGGVMQTGRAPGAEPPDRCAILARNVFDAASGALCPARARARSEPPPAPRPGEAPPPCAGETHKLVATVHSERDPALSFAEVVSVASASRLFQEGDHVDDDEVVAIYPTAVHFKQSSGQYCSLTMFGEPIANHSPVQATDLGSGITAVNETRFTVPRALVDDALQDPESVLRSIRVVPQAKDGQLLGVKVYGIRRDSVLHALGLQNGDALLAINGLEIATPDAALEAYARLRGASNLALSLERRGRAMTVDYAIE